MTELIAGFVATTMRFVGTLSLSLPAYVVIALLLWLFSDARRSDGSLRSAFRFLFPAEVYRNHSARIDFWHMLLSITLWGQILSLLFSIWAGIEIAALLTRELGAMPTLAGPIWVIAFGQMLFIAVFRDLGFWTGHYLMHVVPVLWRFHRPHHSAEFLSIFTSYRLHPMDRIITRLFHSTLGGIATGVILWLTGSTMHRETVALLAAFGTVVSIKTLFDHGTIWLGYGPFNWLISSPMMHQIHHSTERKHWDKNLAEFFSLWDWLFGTIYVPQKKEIFAKGIRLEELGEANPHRTLWGFYVEPFKSFWAMLREGDIENWKTHRATSEPESPASADPGQIPAR